MRLILVPLCMFILAIGRNGSGVVIDATMRQKATCPDEIAWKGKYVNYSYGFSIVIPAGLKGFWNSARCVNQGGECTCMSDHGRIIPLGANPNGPDRLIEAYADYGADLENGTVAEAVSSNLDLIRQLSEAHTFTVRHDQVTKLGGLPARRVLVRYRDRHSKDWMTEDFIDAMGNGVRYLLYLRTPASLYPQDRITFDRVVTTFKLTKEEPGHS